MGIRARGCGAGAALAAAGDRSYPWWGPAAPLSGVEQLLYAGGCAWRNACSVERVEERGAFGGRLTLCGGARVGEKRGGCSAEGCVEGAVRQLWSVGNRTAR